MDMLLEAHTVAVLVKLTVNIWITASLVAGQLSSHPRLERMGTKAVGGKAIPQAPSINFAQGILFMRHEFSFLFLLI